MSSRVFSASFVAAVIAGGFAVGAQAQAQQPPAQQPPAAQMATPADAVTIVGCVAKETDVLRPRVPMPTTPGMGDEFVLTQAKTKSATEAPEPAAAETPAPTGTSGSVNRFGIVYRATGDKEAELKNYVGQRVEITGAFKGAPAAAGEPGAMASGSGVMAQPTVDNTREFTIVSIAPVAGTCAPIVK